MDDTNIRPGGRREAIETEKNFYFFPKNKKSGKSFDVINF
jgi:hypothetical protein